jgi:hypothetical protein
VVLVNGKRYFDPPIGLISRHSTKEHYLNWLVHDQVGGNQISLGSFSHLLPAFTCGPAANNRDGGPHSCTDSSGFCCEPQRRRAACRFNSSSCSPFQ